MENADCSQHAYRSQVVLPPGLPAYSSSMGSGPLTDKDVNEIEGIDEGALIFGVIQYDDSVGNTYETGFCSYRLRTGAVMNCEKYNYIKRVR